MDVASLLIPLAASADAALPMREWAADELMGWNSALGSPVFSVFLWWLMLALPGWLAWPLLRRPLQTLGGAGFLLTRTLSWLLLGWLSWWLASTIPGGNRTGYVWLLAAVMGLACLTISWRQRRQLAAFLREHWRIILCGELLFAVAFVGFTFVRMHNPDIWHPTLGGEKLMEFAFLNGILRSAELPPADPHFAGETINYYYFGLYLAAWLAKLGGFPPEVTFTLAVPALFALSVLNTYAIAFSWFYRGARSDFRRAATLSLLAPIFVCVIGNQAGAVRFAAGADEAAYRYDFWLPSRIMDGVITEFPYWSFLFADLHPHLISIPFFLCFLAILLAALRRQGDALSWRAWLLPSWLLGALACINPWDLPSAFGLLTLVALHSGSGNAGPRAVLRRAGFALGCLVIAWGFFAPFFWHFRPTGVSGLGFVRSPDAFWQWLQIWALPLSVLGCGWWLGARSYPSFRHSLHRASLLAAVVALVPALAGWFVAAASLFLLATAIGLFARRASIDASEHFVWFITIAGLLLLAGMQFVYVRDFLDGSAYHRMNTVFKFSVHAWLLLMLATALVLPRLVAAAYSAGTLGRLSILPLAAMGALGMVFPIWGTAARIETRIQGAQDLPPTLDALAFMRTAFFQPPDTRSVIRLAEDRAAVRWLGEHVRRQALILESSQVDYYRNFGTRIASLTGLAGLNGMHQSEQRDPAQVAARASLHHALWTPLPGREFCTLYRHHGVDIVYAGQLEQINHPRMFEEIPKLVRRGCLVPVFRRGSTTIYFTSAFMDHRAAVGIAVTPLGPATLAD